MLRAAKLLFISTVVSVGLTIATTAQVKPAAGARGMDPRPASINICTWGTRPMRRSCPGVTQRPSQVKTDGGLVKGLGMAGSQRCQPGHNVF